MRIETTLPEVRSPALVLVLALALTLAASPGTALAAAAPTASAAAVLAAASGQVSIERPGTPAPIAGTIGMRLLAGDTVRVGGGSSATVYLAGGGLVRIPGGSRIEIPREAIPGGGATPAAAAGAVPPPTEASTLATAMSSRSVEVLEAGLWILNDPDGSVLLSAMRGEADDWTATAGGAMEPLSPRFETVFENRPRFVWSGTGPTRVVVARGKEIIWRGPLSSLGALTMPADGLELKNGEVYRWWLEAEAGGTPTESVPFRIAERKAVAEATRFEKEVEGLTTGDDAQGLASLLRCGYYVEVGAWSRVIAAAADLRRRDPGSPAAERALDGSRRQMRLGAEGLSRLTSPPASGSGR